ncbi:MAG: hypothetical protein OdinLCB4_005775 [Candidatus Odinarchaeum yellowstonii]|uniref:Uncharacterized protein n=1 Tax=Odinarchaeota yellowstonii (strain LCB_4) TaxID=1841599 RepID=A0AAF0D1L7_ODILC|nr:MAG: hypothetical protein OdinLCB4_005775 [Candidatus Odinarchaeum yellowstonii]
MEKRLRLKRDPNVQKGYAAINPDTAKLLDVSDGKTLEIVVAKKKFQFKVKVDSKIEQGVHLSSEEMVEKGLMDNTIATVREAKL